MRWAREGERSLLDMHCLKEGGTCSSSILSTMQENVQTGLSVGALPCHALPLQTSASFWALLAATCSCTLPPPAPACCASRCTTARRWALRCAGVGLAVIRKIDQRMWRLPLAMQLCACLPGRCGRRCGGTRGRRGAAAAGGGAAVRILRKRRRGSTSSVSASSLCPRVQVSGGGRAKAAFA